MSLRQVSRGNESISYVCFRNRRLLMNLRFTTNTINNSCEIIILFIYNVDDSGLAMYKYWLNESSFGTENSPTNKIFKQDYIKKDVEMKYFRACLYDGSHTTFHSMNWHSGGSRPGHAGLPVLETWSEFQSYKTDWFVPFIDVAGYFLRITTLQMPSLFRRPSRKLYPIIFRIECTFIQSFLELV